MHAPSPFEDVNEEEYLRIMHTNTDGLFRVTQAVLPIMKNRSQATSSTSSPLLLMQPEQAMPPIPLPNMLPRL